MSESVRRFQETAEKEGAPSAADVCPLLSEAAAEPSPRRRSGGDGIRVGLGDVALLDGRKECDGASAMPYHSKGAVGPISNELNDRLVPK